MKILPKHLRVANRYILLKIITEKPISYEDFTKAYTETLKKLVGIFGFARLEVQILKNKYQFPYAIIKTKPKSVLVCQAGCAYMQTIQNQPVRLQTIQTSGQIHKLEESVKENGHANDKSSDDGI